MVGIISILGLRIIIEANNKQLYQSIASSLSYSATNIESILGNVELMSNIMIADDVIQTQLSRVTQDPMARGEAYKALYYPLQNYFSEFKKNHITYMSIHDDYLALNTYTPLAEKTPKDVTDYLIQQAVIGDGQLVWTTKYSENYGLFLSRAIRKIKNLSLEQIGILNICLDMDAIVKETTDFSNQYSESSYLLFDHNKLIYHSNQLTEQDSKIIQEILSSEKMGVITLNKHKYFAVKGIIPKYKWDYICLVSYDHTYNSIFLSYCLYGLIILVSIILSILLSNILMETIVKHFNHLINKMKIFRGQEAALMDVGYDYQTRKDEIGLLHRQFSSMANEIQELIQVNYINELLVKDSQLKALETQINPHFLYNILESVNWRAKAIGEKQISLMVESLGNLLRTTLSQKNDHFSLRQEMSLVQSYMTIQQIRFEDHLHFDLSIDDCHLTGAIPKLTIQPLVENAIRYSLEENTEECFINISTDVIEDDLIIYVKNSGSQFESNFLEKLTSQEIMPHGFGIGILNINNRLKLTFGDSYGLSFYNELETAVAQITIPFQPV